MSRVTLAEAIKKWTLVRGRWVRKDDIEVEVTEDEPNTPPHKAS